MSVQVEKLENNMAKLTIEVAAEEFVAATTKAYNKNKNQISVPGFRKGKVPQAMVEKMYGASMFYEEAANDLIPGAYEAGYHILSGNRCCTDGKRQKLHFHSRSCAETGS